MAGTAQEKVMYPTSERTRKLQQLTYDAGQKLSRELPRDTVLKSIQLRLSGSVVTTFASGTPVADAQSIFDNLATRIDIVIAGSRVVKSVRPHIMRMQQLFFTQVAAERKSSAGATAALGNLPTVEGGFVFGTTGQITTVAESLTIFFEMMYAEPGLGRETTWLNLKGVTSAVLEISTAPFSALQGFGNAAPVVYSGSTLKIDIYTMEAQDVDSRVVFSDWKQTTKVQPFNGQAQGQIIDINRGNKLSGIFLFAQDGAAGSATTATGKLASNLLITNFQLVLNGQTNIQSGDFLGLQAKNRTQYGVVAPMIAGVSQLDGCAHINLLARRDLSTALSVEPPNVDNVQLIVDTAAPGIVSYATPANLTIMTEEIVYPR